MNKVQELWRVLQRAVFNPESAVHDLTNQAEKLAAGGGVVAELAPFVDGVYTGSDGDWAVLRPDALVGDSRFLDAAR